MKKLLVMLLCMGMLFACADDANEEQQKTDNIKQAERLLAKDPCYKYHYETLSKKKQKLYAEIYMGLAKHEKKIKVSSTDEDLLYEIIELVSYDHPEFYYYSGSSIYNGAKKSELIIGYINEEESQKAIKKQLKSTLKEVYQRIPENATDFDKIKCVYDYMIERCEYVDGAKNNQNILSSLVSNQTVCAGYAKGIQYILNDMDIPCAYIVGTIINPDAGENSSHAWNMVELNGTYYYLDATWGDVVEYAPHTCYAYFLMSQDEMKQLYVPETNTKETAVYDNLFIHNGIYLNEYNENIVGQIMMQCISEGKNVMEIKCSPQLFQTMEYELAENGKIYDIMYANGLNFDNITYLSLPELSMIEMILY